MLFLCYLGYSGLDYQSRFWQDASDLPGLSTKGPSTSGSRNPKGPLDDKDVVDLLDGSEALEMVEFDPSVEPLDTWQLASFPGSPLARRR